MRRNNKVLILLRLNKVILILTIGILMGIVDSSKATDKKKILAHYMPWYESKPISGNWGWHWTMNLYKPDEILSNGQHNVASHYYPLIGPYDSSDADALECQVLLMKLAGIDGIIIDWYGIENFYDYGMIHRNTQHIINYIKKAKLEYAICYEDQSIKYMVRDGYITEDKAVEYGKKALSWLQDNCFNSQSYLKMDNRPALFVFGPQYFSGQQWDQLFSVLPNRPFFYVMNYLHDGSDGVFGWPPVNGNTTTPEGWRKYLINIYKNADGKNCVGAVFPQFHDIYESAGAHKSYGFIDAQYTKTFDETLDMAIKSNCDLIQIVTWNDYGEGTMIEPTVEFGYSYLEKIQQARKQEFGTSFPYTAEDLRLPITLYQLKKKYQNNRLTVRDLSKCSEQLFSGNLANAKKLMEKYQKPFAECLDENGQYAPYKKKSPAYVNDGLPWPYTSGRPVTVSIDAGKQLEKANYYLFGNNLSWWMGKEWILKPQRLDNARQAGFRFWRFPGGSASDHYHWDGNYQKHPGKGEFMFEGYTLKSEDFIRFCKATDAEAIVTINFGLSRYGSLEEAKDLAARWVRYFNVENDFPVRYWEIGNEVFSEWETGYEVNGEVITGQLYAEYFREIASAMRAVDPNIFIGACAVSEDSKGTSKTGGFNFWMRNMLPGIIQQADFLVIHEYFHWPFDWRNGSYVAPKNEELLANAQRIRNIREQIDEIVLKYGDGKKTLPIALTEFNILLANAPPTVQLVNTLFTTELLGEFARWGIKAANIWNWKNGYHPDNPEEKFAKGGGEHGMLASGEYSPVPDGTPWASYYAYAIFHRAYGDTLVDSQSSDRQVKIYATTFSSDDLGLVMVNESEKSVEIQLQIEGFHSNGKANAWVVTGEPTGNLNTSRIMWNGVSGHPGGGGPFPIDQIKPYILSFNPEKLGSICIPGASVVGLVLKDNE